VAAPIVTVTPALVISIVAFVLAGVSLWLAMQVYQKMEAMPAKIDNLERLILEISAQTLEIEEKMVSTEPEIGGVEMAEQFIDVDVTHSSYEALRELCDRYKLPVGYSDRRFMGERAISRYELVNYLSYIASVLESRLK